MITRKVVGERLVAYLNGQSSLAQLVDWAETVMIEDELEEGNEKLIFEMLARIGAADVDSFKLSWQDIAEMLEKLGYRANVALQAA